MTPFIAEILGTFTLLLLGDGVVANIILKDTKGFDDGWNTIATAWGLAVFAGVVVAGPYSGAHLNPAVTVGLAAAGSFPWADVAPYILAQMIGAMLGAFFVWVSYYDHFKATDDPGTLLGVFATIPEIRHNTANLLTEIVGTIILMFGVFYATGAEITPSETPIGLGSVGALPIGLFVWVIGLSLGGPTGYAINPARDLGPRIVHALLPLDNKGSSQWNYAWIPIVGPIIGAVLAAGIYMLFGQ